MAGTKARRALVSGGGSGIGRAIALRAAEDGTSIAILDRDRDAAEQTAQQVHDHGGQALALTADVTDEQQVAQAVAHVRQQWGSLDAVCAAAGVQLFGQDAPCHELDLEVLDRTHAVNIRGMVAVCKHTLPLLIESGGSLVCLGSPTGLYGVAPGFTAYSSAKAATLGLVRVIAADYAQHGVRANMVVPGFTDTPLVQDIMTGPDALATELARIPLGRPGTAQEVAAMVSFLWSTEASFSTGAVFTTDGGATAV